MPSLGRELKLSKACEKGLQPHYSSMIYAKSRIKNSYYLKDDKFGNLAKLGIFKAKAIVFEKWLVWGKTYHYQKHKRKDSKTKLQFIYAKNW